MTYGTTIHFKTPLGKAVYEFVRDHPGATFSDIVSALPAWDRDEIFSAVLRMNEVVIRSTRDRSRDDVCRYRVMS